MTSESHPQMWLIEWVNAKTERFWGRIVNRGEFTELIHYTGGVAGFPRPDRTQVVRTSEIKGWRSDA